MRLAVFDTNVIVSAGIRAAGPPARLVMDWVLEGQLQLATCPAVIAEYRRVLARPKFHRHGFPPIWAEVLIQDSLQLQDPLAWPLALPDPDDAVFLALAERAGAVLVTGNSADYPADRCARVVVMTPADYLRALEAAP